MEASRSDKEQKVIHLANDDSIRIETVDQFEESIFKDQYKRAFRIIENIIRNPDNEDDDLPGCGNIIAFLGERGCGKSSAMYSLGNVLVNDEKYSYSEFYTFRQESGKKILPSFELLGKFDASTLENGENIFDNVLSEIFFQCEDREKKLMERSVRSSQIDYRITEIRQDIIRIFTDFQNLHRFSKPADAYENTAISSLKYYASSFKIRKRFIELIEKYRSLLKRSDFGIPYFVLMIDDLDMNTEHGFAMLGQIERYLTISGIIVLMTGSYEQLEILGQRHFISMFPTINKDMKNSQIDYARQTALEYLEKTIPIQHRIYMPAFHNVLSNFSSQLVVKKEEKAIKKTLLGKIARRTKVYFDGLGTKRHFLEPNSLRGLNDYYSFLDELTSLNDLSDNPMQEAAQKAYNHERFLQDISYRFVFQYLNEEQREVFRTLCNVGDQDKNFYLINYIRKCAQKRGSKDSELFWEEGWLSQRTNRQSKEESCSYGDLLYVLHIFARNESKNKRLGHCILIIYSFLINRCINDIVSGQNAFYKKTIRRVLGTSVSGDWGREIFHCLTLGQWERTHNVPAVERCYLGSNRNVQVLAKNIHWSTFSAISWKKASVDEVMKWFLENPDFLKSLEIMMLFWENFRTSLDMGADQHDYHAVKFSWNETGCPPDDTLFLDSFQIVNDFGDFNILAFITNSYRYKEFFDMVHKSFLQALFPNIQKKDKEELIKKLRELGLYKDYYKWEQQYKTAIPVPFQHTDIYYHILKRLKRRIQISVPREINTKEILIWLERFYDDIARQLGELDEFYKHGEQGSKFKEIFEACPFIKTLKSWNLKKESNVAVNLYTNKEEMREKSNNNKNLENDPKDNWRFYRDQLANIFVEIAVGNRYNHLDVMPDNNDDF